MFRILRPINLLLLQAVLLTLWYRLCVPNLAEAKFREFILICISVICTAAAAYIFNDIIDIPTDKINKPQKVFIKNHKGRKKAFALYFFLNAVAIIAALFIFDLFVFIITISSIAFLYLYSLKLKQTIFWGNLTIAILSALPVLEIYYFFKPLNVDNEFFAYAIFAFLTTLLREIAKDKEDSDGDLKSGIKTLANSISDSKLKFVLFAVNCSLFICLVCFLFIFNKYTMLSILVYLLLMILPALIIFALINKLKNQSNYSRLSFFIKIYMFLGLIRLWI